jgi:hypothetical protein
MDISRQAARAPAFVGWLTLGIGGALLAAPGPAARWLGVDDRMMRAFGAADLALVPGLLAGRPRWPWMTARAGLNVGMACALAALAPRAGEPARVRGAALALLAVTVPDGVTARSLRRAET